MIKPISPKFALSVYLRAEASAKVVQCFAETGEFEKIVLYSQKVGYTPDYVYILRMILRSNPDKSVDYAKSLVNQDPPLADISQVRAGEQAQEMWGGSGGERRGIAGRSL